MSEGVGSESAGDAGGAGGVSDDAVDVDAREGSAGSAEEEVGGVGVSGEFGSEVFEVVSEGVEGEVVDGDDAFASSFSDAAEVADLEVDVLCFEVGRFAGAHSGGVEEFEEGVVAGVHGVLGVEGLEEVVGFLSVEDAGDSLPGFWCFEDGADVSLGKAGEEVVAEEHAKGDEVSGDGGGGEVFEIEASGVGLEDDGGDVFRGGEALVEAELGEAGEVASVGEDGVLCEATLGEEVVEEGFDLFAGPGVFLRDCCWGEVFAGGWRF